MIKKSTYEELEQKLKIAEEKALGKKQTEKALANHIIALNSFINNISDMAWVKDRDSRFIAVNQTFCEAVGMKAESIIGHTCKACFTKEEAKKSRGDDLKVMEGRKQRVIEEKILDSQNKEVWFETTKSPMFDASEAVIGTVALSRDITDQKKAAQELSYKTTLLEAQTQASIDGILVIDSQGKAVLSNERMREMWHVPQEIWASGDDEVLLRHAIALLNAVLYKAQVYQKV